MSTDIEQAGRAQTDAMLVKAGENGFSMAGLAEVFVRSGFFKDVKQQSQAIVKILYGQELGLKPIQSMLAIHMVEGRPEVAAATLGAMVKKSGRYDYRITEHTEVACAIAYFDVSDGKREGIGVSRFTMEDATRAGLAGKFNYKNYPKNMMFARAMSNGVKWYCLDAVGSVPVYTEGEIVEERESLGLPIDPEPAPDNPFMPTRKAPEPAQEVAAPEVVSEAPAEIPAPPAGSEEPPEAPSGRYPRGPGASPYSLADQPALIPDDGNAPQTFSIGPSSYVTKGVTKEQMTKLFALCPPVNRKVGRGKDKELLFQMFGILTRNDLTRPQADRYIEELEKLLA
jgi:hypothetical protein